MVTGREVQLALPRVLVEGPGLGWAGGLGEEQRVWNPNPLCASPESGGSLGIATLRGCLTDQQ